MTGICDPRSAAVDPDPIVGYWFDPAELPAWARAHIPAEPLIEEPSTTSRRAFRRTPKPASVAAVDKTDEIPIVSDVSDARYDNQAPTRIARPHVKRGLLTMAAGVTIAAISAALGVAMASPDSQTLEAAPLPQTPAPTKPADTLVADFCPDRTDGTTVTTSGPGNASTPAGVIAAFDYAYYTERDGQRVHDLMSNPPNSAEVIQSAIDNVPDGTRACVTTTPTNNPLVFVVDVKLDNPSGADGSLRQRITVAKAGTTYKIALVEDR